MEALSSEQISDQQLMLAVRDGDIEKLGKLFERHHIRLFNFFLRMTASRQLSEDLVQEVFVRLLKYRNTYIEDHRFTTWMFKIARNVRTDFFRKQPSIEISIENQQDEYPSMMQTPGQKTEENEKMQIMLHALSRIPPEKREVLLLRGVHGLKFDEIAEILKCSINTVKSRAFRAVRELKTAIHGIDKVRER